jgi:ketol-acid reductoisomerase
METKIDLLTEQGLIPIILNALIAKYEVEVEAGIPAEISLLENYLSKELSHIFEIMASQGIVEQMSLHSQTSQYGQMSRSHEFDSTVLKDYMKEQLRGIDDGSFAREWSSEQNAGYPELHRLYKKYRNLEMIEKEQETINKLGLR